MDYHGLDFNVNIRITPRQHEQSWTYKNKSSNSITVSRVQGNYLLPNINYEG
jgi:hypothetical protein